MGLEGLDASQSGVVLGRASTGAGRYEEVPVASLSRNDGTAAVCLIQNYPRTLVASSTLTAPTSGTLRLDAVWLPAGLLVSSIAYFAGTTALGTGSNQWFALFDRNRNLLAITADDTDTAWGANAAKRLALTTPYRTPAAGLYYVGLCVVASTMPTLAGVVTVATGPRNIGFVSGGNSTASLTDPASCTTPADAITAGAIGPYIELY
jgi:hypothetical protein